METTARSSATTRRFVLAGLAGVGAAVSVGAGAFAQSAPDPRRIDVHHHLLPPRYLAAARERILAQSSSYAPVVLQWTPAKSLEQMDKYGIETAILSNPSLWTWFAKDEARALARDTNEFATGMGRDHPGRFGVFAALPMPDIEGSLKEIEYAFDTLKVDGAQLTTSYDDKWPGDPLFDPVFEELNRRKAVVFIHPAAPACCRSLIPGLAAPTIEFMFDVTRSIASLLYRGSFARFSDIRFIFTHDGGALPQLAERLTRNAAMIKDVAARNPGGGMAELQRLHYDITTSTSRPALSALKAFVPVSQMLFGSDYPYLTPPLTIDGLDAYGFAAADLAAINRANAAALLPRFKG